MQNFYSMRYFIELAYNGSAFHGWQIQPNANTVQAELQKAFSIFLKTDTAIIGAGRTDTGVHAKYYVAHFDTEAVIANTDEFLFRINRILPQEIVVNSIFQSASDANSRFTAISRSYEYHISTKKDPFNQGLAWHFTRKLDVDLMNEAALYLFDHKDFTSFSKLHTQTKTNNCTIYRAEWCKYDGLLVFHVKANRFLRNMVRAIVGTLINVGLGKIPPIEINNIIEQKNRNIAGFSVPAHGLYLTNIEYPSGTWY